MTNIVSLNYCVHAIEHLSQFAKKIPESMPDTKRNMLRIVELLGMAQKFILPERGELIEIKELRVEHLEMLRLPYPLVALEIPFNTATSLIAEGPLAESPSSKRIALLFDESFVQESRLIPLPNTTPGIYIVVLYFDDVNESWNLVPKGAFVPRATFVGKASERAMVESAIRTMETLQQEGAVGANPSVMDYRFFDVLREMSNLFAQQLGPSVAATRIELDLRDELMVTWEFCVTVNCANIKSFDVPASAKLNAKRVRSGKLPFFSYKVLDIAPETKGGKPGTPGSDGDKAGPRTHLRRGHPRRLADNRVVYVRAAMVNAGSVTGTIKKDYRVLPAKAS